MLKSRNRIIWVINKFIEQLDSTVVWEKKLKVFVVYGLFS